MPNGWEKLTNTNTRPKKAGRNRNLFKTKALAKKACLAANPPTFF